MGLRFLLAAFVPALVLAACGDDNPKRPPIGQSDPRPVTPAGGGGTAVNDAGSTDSGDAGVCTDLAVGGAQIPQQIVTGDPPAGTSGPLVAGIYNITDATLYGGASTPPGPSGNSYQGSIRITGTTFERHMIYRTAGGAIVETAVKGTISTGVSSLIALDCPYSTQEQITYTAAGNNLTIANLVTKDSLAFTKQP
jgi:hypothetical protein